MQRACLPRTLAAHACKLEGAALATHAQRPVFCSHTCLAARPAASVCPRPAPGNRPAQTHGHRPGLCHAAAPCLQHSKMQGETQWGRLRGCTHERRGWRQVAGVWCASGGGAGGGAGGGSSRSGGRRAGVPVTTAVSECACMANGELRGAACQTPNPATVTGSRLESRCGLPFTAQGLVSTRSSLQGLRLSICHVWKPCTSATHGEVSSRCCRHSPPVLGVQQYRGDTQLHAGCVVPTEARLPASAASLDR